MRPLSDNLKTEYQTYIITVDTGFKSGAGTRSNIEFALSGHHGDTGTRQLAVDGITGLKRGSRVMFMLTTLLHLGPLTNLRIWHDNSGPGASSSWFLRKIMVRDVARKKVYTFLCNQWLAAEKGDGQISRVLKAASQTEVSSLSYLFKETSQLKLTEHHMWTSVFFRPFANNFTRVQRLSCCVSFLFLTMVTSAMFYQTEERVERPRALHIGPLSFSMQELGISIITTLIVFPVNLIIIQIFRKTNNFKSPLWHQIKRRLSNRSLINSNEMKDQKSFDFEKQSDSTSTEAEVDEISFDTSRKTTWPAWLRLVAWGLVVIAILVSAFFVILYSMDWGPRRSNEWLTSFVLSFLESLLIVDPIKVITVSFFATILLRKALLSEKEGDRYHSAYEKVNSQPSLLTTAKMKPEADIKRLRKQRRRRLKEMKAREVIIEVVTSILFLLVVSTIAYINRPSNSYLVHKVLRNAFVDGPSGFMSKVTHHATYFDWLLMHFLPNFLLEEGMNGEALHWRERQFLADRASYRVGPARLRQLRGHLDTCPRQPFDRNCSRAYGQKKEGRLPYGIGRINPQLKFPDYFSHDAWRYTDSNSIKGPSYWGRTKSYSGGGHIAELDLSLSVSSRIVLELKNNSWLDRQSRAVFTEFLIYNANVNLFGYVTLLAEFPPSGGAVTSFSIDVTRLDTAGLAAIFLHICEAIFLVGTIYFFVMLCKRIYKDKLKVFHEIKTWMEILILFSCLFLVVVFIARHSAVRRTMEHFRRNRNKFVQFRHILLCDHIFKEGLGFLSFIAILKFMVLMRLNKRFAQLAASMKHAARMLSPFAVELFIIFMGYAMATFLWYGRHVYQFATFVTAGQTLVIFGLGSFDLVTDLMAIDTDFTSWFFMSYMFLMNFVFFSFLVTIIMDSHESFRANPMLKPQDHKLVKVITQQVRKFFHRRFHGRVEF